VREIFVPLEEYRQRAVGEGSAQRRGGGSGADGGGLDDVTAGGWDGGAVAQPASMGAVHPTERLFWPAIPAPPMARAPFWTTAFTHVEEVPWPRFAAALFATIPVLAALPEDYDRVEPTLARLLQPFGRCLNRLVRLRLCSFSRCVATCLRVGPFLSLFWVGPINFLLFNFIFACLV
jgi:hypothetical protein